MERVGAGVAVGTSKIRPPAVVGVTVMVGESSGVNVAEMLRELVMTSPGITSTGTICGPVWSAGSGTTCIGSAFSVNKGEAAICVAVGEGV
jgi:hypothetical protein